MIQLAQLFQNQLPEFLIIALVAVSLLLAIGFSSSYKMVTAAWYRFFAFFARLGDDSNAIRLTDVSVQKLVE